MNDELDKIKKNQTWELVSRTKDMNVIGTKQMDIQKQVQWAWSCDKKQG